MKYQFSLLVLTVAAASAQIGAQSEKSDALDRIEGFQGRLTQSHNPTLRQTVIVLSTTTEASQQVVLRFQHETSPGLPAEWSGTGRLLVGRGLVAVIADDGARRMFRFPERRVPASLDRLGPFESIDVFGIARFGKDAPLRSEQIELLKSTGVPTAVKSGGRAPVD